MIPCPSTGISVEVFPAEVVFDDGPCALVDRAWTTVQEALEREALGGLTFELADVRSALVGPVTEVSADGVPIHETWQVQFFLEGTAHDVLAVIDRRTGDIHVELTHKPL